MKSFDETFERLLLAVEADMGEPFTLRRDAMVAGRWVALTARFGLDGERRIFGLISTGSSTHCHEICLFLPAETLDDAALDGLLAYIEQVHEQEVRPDAAHEFTMVSLVIAAGSVDAKQQKRIKKYSFEKRYKKPQNGWSTTRLAVVDLSNDKIYANLAGTALRDRLLPSMKKL